MSKTKKIIIGTVGLIVLFIGFILSIFAYFFYDTISNEYAAIEVKQLPQKNPTSYVFNGNLEQVRKKIISATEYPEPDSHVPFKQSDSLELRGYLANAYFYICESKDDICLGTNGKRVEEIFKKKENQNDIYLASDGTRIYSTTYYANGKPLEFRMDFHIHLEAIDSDKTKVAIFPINPVVYKGYGGLGMHGAILKKEIPVAATTVEEYQLLHYIGFALGEKDMPKVILPT